jgi:hypothetical protein
MTLMKSVLVSKPAKADFCESQSGAETMPNFPSALHHLCL